jgi:hypothetical protein
LDLPRRPRYRADLDTVAAAGIPIMSAFAQSEIWAEHGIGVAPAMRDRLKRQLDVNVKAMAAAKARGIRLLLGTDSGNAAVMTPSACRIAESSSLGRHIPGDYAGGTDQRIIADADTRQNDRTTANPYLATDADRAAEFQTGGAHREFARMTGHEELHRGAKLRASADADRDYIEDHPVEAGLRHPRQQIQGVPSKASAVVR